MRFRLLLILSVLTVSLGLTVSAQDQPVITIAVPAFWEMVFDEAVLDAFEAQYGVDVQMIYRSQQPTPPSALDSDAITGWQDDLQDYAESADVLYVDNSILQPEVTRAGFVMNLNPLLQVDNRFNPENYHQAVLESFMWDEAQWALPIAGNTTLVEYIPSAFDSAGLVYPSENWSLQEFGDTARALTEYDADGNVTLPGLLIGTEDRTMLLYSLLGREFSDGGQPDMPAYPTDELTAFFELWQELESEGVIASNAVDFIERASEVPMKIGVGGFFMISVEVGDEENEDVNATGGSPFGENPIETALAVLPNGSGSVSATGFAVSNGTANPQLAYELVRYLSDQPTVASYAFGSEPAKSSYDVAEVESEDNGVSVMVGSGGQRSEADIALIQETLDSGIPASVLRFGHYLTQVDGLIQNGMDIAGAIQTVEADANRAVIQMMETDRTLIVDTPQQIVLPKGESLLEFGIASFVQPLPNEDRWQALAQEFADSDPDVGAINFNTGFMQPDQILRQNDCVYQPTITGLFDLNTDELLPVDPLLFADPSYDINSLPPTTLQQLQLNGITYGVPLTIQPEVLVYDKSAFEDMGIIPPVNGWTINELDAILRQIDDALDDDEYPLESISAINTHLLMLMAAQGGRLFDTSTTPATLDFTSPESISAVRQILDLIKEDLIEYDRLGDSAGFDFVAIDGGEFSNLQANNFLGFFNDELGILPYPNGTQYTPIVLGVGAGLISRESAHPEACYRWLSFLANHPSAFTDMPALLNTLDQPEVQTAFGEDRLAVFQTVADQARQSNAINPIVWDPIIMVWLNRAFDAYVFDNGDLEAELDDAQQQTQTYVDCISQPLEEDASQENQFEQIQMCAEQMGVN